MVSRGLSWILSLAGICILMLVNGCNSSSSSQSPGNPPSGIPPRDERELKERVGLYTELAKALFEETVHDNEFLTKDVAAGPDLFPSQSKKAVLKGGDEWLFLPRPPGRTLLIILTLQPQVESELVRLICSTIEKESALVSMWCLDLLAFMGREQVAPRDWQVYYQLDRLAAAGLSRPSPDENVRNVIKALKNLAPDSITILDSIRKDPKPFHGLFRRFNPLDADGIKSIRDEIAAGVR